uniref:HDC07857 n=1 Tax=Drosophila melanogaster TaxID=7227 RepID=Q6IM11_DROME|nr:TPA_inf: HDC07857 [Drosophila melanogaster]
MPSPPACLFRLYRPPTFPRPVFRPVFPALSAACSLASNVALSAGVENSSRVGCLKCQSMRRMIKKFLSCPAACPGTGARSAEGTSRTIHPEHPVPLKGALCLRLQLLVDVNPS